MVSVSIDTDPQINRSAAVLETGARVSPVEKISRADLQSLAPQK